MLTDPTDTLQNPPGGWHEHHHHLLLGGSRLQVERLFGATLQDFESFFNETCSQPEHANHSITTPNSIVAPSPILASASADAIGCLNGWIRRFLAPLCPRPNYLELAVEASLAQAKADGVAILESSLGIDFPDLIHRSAESVLTEILQVHARTAPELILKLDLGIPRSQPVSQLASWLNAILNLAESHPEIKNLLSGIDLYDVEDAQPPENFLPLFQTARQAGLKLKAHVGEFGNADSIRNTVETLDLDEVQHGIHAADSPDVLRFLANRGTLLNLAPASNRILRAMDFSRKPHPVRTILEAGVRFTLATDDFLLFEASIPDQIRDLAPFFTPEERKILLKNCLAKVSANH